jgi:hypothetical protein
MMKVVALFIFVLVLCMIKLMLSNKCKSEIKLNASLIPCEGYDKNKTHSFLFMLSILDGLTMLFLFLKVMLTLSLIPLACCSTYPKLYIYLSAKT